MRHFLGTVLLIVLAGGAAKAQQTEGDLQQASATAPQGDTEFAHKATMLRQIASFEAEARSAQANHVDNETLAKIYLKLAGVYEYGAMYPKSESALRQVISLLQTGPQEQLAGAISHLALVHLAMGELGKSEKEALEALRILENMGDRVVTAEAWSDLASIYVKERRFKPALEYAQEAMTVLGDDPHVDAAERIWVRQTLGYALCGNHDWTHAAPLLKDAVELSKISYGESSPPVDFSYYVMGYAAWQCGAMDPAAEWMQQGTARMKVDLGSSHPVYIDALSQYALFLHERGQTEAAAVADREVRQANSVVDVHTLAGRVGDALVAKPR